MSASLAASRERHCSDRIGWLRAAVLGANDGIGSSVSRFTFWGAAAMLVTARVGKLFGVVAGRDVLAD